MRVIATCTKRIRDKNKTIIGYVLMSDYGEKKEVRADELKYYIKTGQLEVRNLTLTKDNRLVPKEIKNSSEDIRTLDIHGNSDFNNLRQLEKPTKQELKSVNKEKADRVYLEIINNYLGGATDTFESVLLNEILDEHPEGTTLEDLGYNAENAYKLVLDYVYASYEDGMEEFNRNYDEVLTDLEIDSCNKVYILALLRHQLLELLDSEKLSRNHYERKEISVDRLQTRIRNLNRNALVRLINPMEKDSSGTTKVDVRKLKVGVNYIRDRIRDAYFGGNTGMSYY